MKEILKILIRNFSKLFISNIASMVIGIISFPLVIKNLSQEQYGLFVTVFSLVGVSSVLQQMVSSNIILPYVSNAISLNKSDQEKGYLSFYIKSGVKLIILSLIIVNFAANFFYGIHNNQMIVYLSGYILFSQVNTYMINIALMYKKFNYISIVTLLRNAIRFFIIILFILLGELNSANDNLRTYLISEFVLLGFSLSFLKFLKFRLINVENSYHVDKYSIYKDSFTNFSSTSVVEITNISLVTFIKLYYNLEYVGIYGAVKKLISIVSGLFNTFENSLFPYVSVWIKSRKDKKIQMEYINKIIIIITMIGLLVFNLLLKQIIFYFVGEEYVQNVMTFRIASLYVLVYSFQVMQKSIIYSVSQTKILFEANLYSFFSHVIFIFLFCIILKLGLNGIFFSIVISEFISYFYKDMKIKHI